MSSVVVLTPLVIASWPVISAAVTAAVASMGFNVLQAASPSATQEVEKPLIGRRVEIELDDSEILSDARGEQIVVERNGVRATFTRDERGALKLCMEGEAVSKDELRRLGEELVNRVTQQFVYHRVVTELK